MEMTKQELAAADFRVGQKVLVEPKNENSFVSEIIAIDPTKSHHNLYFEFAVKDQGHGIKFWVSLSEIKPIFRRLDSMTLDEQVSYNLLRDGEVILNLDGQGRTFYSETTESVLYLIDNGFDVRGWIDAGLAVDAATLERSSE